MNDVSTTVSRLLNQIDRLLDRYVAFPSDHDRHAVAAWAVHCWAVDAFDSTPRLALLSPEKGSGKTRTLEVLELVVPDPIHAVNLSASALFRLVADEERDTTLLLDEADTYLSAKTAGQHEDLRGLVNAGHRRGAKAYRVRADRGNIVEAFPAFAPVALAGIGDLPDTITDRSVVVGMKRRAPTEQVDPFRRRQAKADTERLRLDLDEWSDQLLEALDGAEPSMPDGVVDRPADVWEPLVAIGDLAGDPWSTRIRDAAVAAVTGREADELTVGARLLSDLETIFAQAGDPEAIATQDLLDALHQDDEAPWGDWYGSPLDARNLAKLLRRYDVRSTTVRPHGHDRTLKGYRRDALVDAWTRWVPQDQLDPEGGPSEEASQASHPSQPALAPEELPLPSVTSSVTSVTDPFERDGTCDGTKPANSAVSGQCDGRDGRDGYSKTPPPEGTCSMCKAASEDDPCATCASYASRKVGS